MTANQHESVGRIARLAAHFADLCTAFNVTLCIMTADEDPASAGAGTLIADRSLPHASRRRCVKVAPIIDETTYAVAMHELGHCLHPLGMCCSSEGSVVMRTTNKVDTLRDMRLRLAEEEGAWEWAHQNALEWTPPMRAVENYALDTYRRGARQLGVKP